MQWELPSPASTKPAPKSVGCADAPRGEHPRWPQDAFPSCGRVEFTPLNRSRRPYRYANQLPFQVENFILNVKGEHTTWGARKIRDRLIRRFSGIPIPAKSTSMPCSIAMV